MKRVLLGAIIVLVLLFAYERYIKKEEKTEIHHSQLIRNHIKNVGKLVVTEGHFSEVLNYKKSKAVFGDFYTSEKRALVVVNADVTVAYDLSEIEYEIDSVQKKLYITHIPEEEIKIYPDLEYYDIQQDFFSEFDETDYNSIKESVQETLKSKIEESALKKNAKNRLISELSKFYILTNSLEWTLVFNEKTVEKIDDITLSSDQVMEVQNGDSK